MLDDPYSPIWSRLTAQGKLDDAGLAKARLVRETSGEKLTQVLTRLGLVSEQDLARAFAEETGLAMVTEREFPKAPLQGDLFNVTFLHEIQAVPIAKSPDGLVVAMADPLDVETRRALDFALDQPAVPRIATAGDLEAALVRLYGRADQEEDTDDSSGELESEDLERIKDTASDAPIIRLVNQLIHTAVDSRASDIHIEPLENTTRVRIRVDGALQDVKPFPTHLRTAVVSRVKILAKLNIAERRLAQDGRMRLAVRGQEIDLRVSTTPTIHGESVVLRILDRSNLQLDFQTLGFDQTAMSAYNAVLDRPHGILLVTGPTGSGKTTTLYTSLHHLNSSEKKILTVEDPVEYQLKGINQVQVKPQIGLTFASALRSFLRQDPDIMMIGEIRDLETAQIAVQAALTGHMILSTLHTNDAASAVTRLLDMGLDDYLLTSTINGIVAQRLVRHLCRSCREPRTMSAAEMDRLGIPHHDDQGRPATIYQAVGCDDCKGTGYSGRGAVMEILPMTDEVRQLVLQRAEARRIQQAATGAGMRSMFRHGMEKVGRGETTVEEVLRVTHEL